MSKVKELYNKINMGWKNVIIFAVITACYTALINQVDFLYDTSFRDIAISFECWILFAIVIIMKSKSDLDSAMKCFVFFLISQPLIYLIEVPFLGWSIMRYYRNWIMWTLATIPMGFIGYYMKRNNWLGLVILAPMQLFLAIIGMWYLKHLFGKFPNHLLSCIFCFATMFIYPIVIFKNKNIKIAGIIWGIISIVICTILSFGMNII